MAVQVEKQKLVEDDFMFERVQLPTTRKSSLVNSVCSCYSCTGCGCAGECSPGCNCFPGCYCK